MSDNESAASAESYTEHWNKQKLCDDWVRPLVHEAVLIEKDKLPNLLALVIDLLNPSAAGSGPANYLACIARAVDDFNRSWNIDDDHECFRQKWRFLCGEWQAESWCRSRERDLYFLLLRKCLGLIDEDDAVDRIMSWFKANSDPDVGPFTPPTPKEVLRSLGKHLLEGDDWFARASRGQLRQEDKEEEDMPYEESEKETAFQRKLEHGQLGLKRKRRKYHVDSEDEELEDKPPAKRPKAAEPAAKAAEPAAKAAAKTD